MNKIRLGVLWGSFFLGTLGGCQCGDSDALNAVRGALLIEPMAVDFGEVAVDDLVPGDVRIRTRGGPAIEIASVRIESGEGVFLLSNPPPTRVSETPARIALLFSPGVEGTHEATLVIEAPDTEEKVFRVPLSGRATQARLQLVSSEPTCGTPGSVSFGIGPPRESLRTSFDVVSAGSALVTIERIELEQGGAFEMALEPVLLPQTLAPEESLTISARYTPVNNGEDQGRILIETAEGIDLRVPLCGVGIAVGICPRPEVVDLGQVARGVRGTRSLRLESCGEEALLIQSIRIANDEVHDSHSDLSVHPPLDFGRPILSGDSIEVEVALTPMLEGPVEGWVRVESNVPETPEIFVPIIGEGIRPCSLLTAPDRLTFLNVPTGSSEVRQLLVINEHPNPCTILRREVVQLTNAFSLVDANPSDITLAPGEAMTVAVQYNPQSNGSSETGRIELETEGQAVATVELLGNPTLPPGCRVDVEPGFINFSVVSVQESARASVSVRSVNPGSPCEITEANILGTSDAGFEVLTPTPVPVVAGFPLTLEVEFVPAAAKSLRGTLRLETTDPNAPQIDIPLFGIGQQPNLCVAPPEINFGPTQSAVMAVSLVACGDQAVEITDLGWLNPDSEITFSQPPSLPITLSPGMQHDVQIRYTSADVFADWTTLVIRSNDPLRPEIGVDVRGGPNQLPPEVGQNLYIWQLGSNGIVRLPLQGSGGATPFYGGQNGQGCSGCHAVSSDGRYMALIEFPDLVVVDTQTSLTVPVGISGSIDWVSWRPDVNSNPPYQFVYADALGEISIASISGPMGPLAGANDPGYTERMPSWGPNGQIVFTRGTQGGAPFGFTGPTDLMMIPETGGTPVPLVGASQNGKANYYPVFSPGGTWIAFTQSDTALTTYAAADAQIRLIKADQTGTFRDLSLANGTMGANSYPTWSLDGRILSFSSNRVGGLGDWDIYASQIDPLTGSDQTAQSVQGANTSSFDHLAVWSR